MKINEINKEWILRKNCTLSPRQFASSLIFVGFLSFLIGMAWAFNGIWVILPFVCLELLGLCIAFFVYSRHATDFERVILTKSDICVESEIGGTTKFTKIPRCWAVPYFKKNKGKGLVLFKFGSTELKVGQFVTEKRRKLFFDEIKGFL